MYSRASNKCIAKNLIIASVREIVMKGFTKWLVILLLFLFIPEGGVMEQGDQREAWNWQILDRAQGEWLEKANKAVADIRFIDETHIPKKETVRYTVIQDERVLVVYAPSNKRQLAFVFDTAGVFLYGISFKPDYDGMDIRLSPYKKGILILDWRFLPGPTVTYISEEEQTVFRYSMDRKYSEFPREPRYSALNASQAELVSDEGCKVIIKDASGKIVVLFDYQEEFDTFLERVNDAKGEQRRIVYVLLGVGLLSSICFFVKTKVLK